MRPHPRPASAKAASAGMLPLNCPARGKCKEGKMKKRNKTGSGVTSLQYVNDTKKQQARSLRKNATHAEEILWEALRNRKVGGLKFRRQQVIDGFVADFYCEAAKLTVEIDGGIHEDPAQQKIDEHREKVFIAKDIYTLRLGNESVLCNLQNALDMIAKTASKRI